jgi:beta-glucosidase
MKINIFRILILTFLVHLSLSAQTNYSFQNPTLTDNARLDNFLSLMTLDEKMDILSTNPGVHSLHRL